MSLLGLLIRFSPHFHFASPQDGAHHLDLRGSNPQDPESVIQARLQEVAYLKQWLAEL